uniref:Uncharacterized protein n=1 Tax=Oryza meridionalis TaxID=40149 RepID=A0A0E0E786_9ORYZ
MAAMALRSLARKVMPAPVTLRRAPPPSRSLHRHSLEDKLRGTASPGTTAPTGTTFEERNPELYAELVKRLSDQKRNSRRMRLAGASAYCVVFVTLLYLGDREKRLFEKSFGVGK